MAARRHTVDTIAALTAIAKSELKAGQQTTVAGYYAAGDKEAVTYVWSAASTATANGGTALAADEGGTGRWLLKKSLPTWKDFGAKGDGTGDDTPFIQAAITATGVGRLGADPGTYPTTEPLTTAYGQNITIIATSVYGGVVVDVQHAGHGLTPGFTINIKGISFIRNASFIAAAKAALSGGIYFDDTAGAINGAAYSRVEDCVCNNHYYGIYSWGTHQYLLNNVANTNAFGIWVRGSGATLEHNASENNDYASLIIEGSGIRVNSHYADGNCVIDDSYGVIHFITSNVCYVGSTRMNNNNGGFHYYLKDTSRCVIDAPYIYDSTPKIKMESDSLDCLKNQFRWTGSNNPAQVTLAGTVANIYQNLFPEGTVYQSYSQAWGGNFVQAPYGQEYLLSMPFANNDIGIGATHVLPNNASPMAHAVGRSLLWYLPGYQDRMEIEITAAGLKLYNDGGSREFDVSLDLSVTVPGAGDFTYNLVEYSGTDSFGSETVEASPTSFDNLWVSTDTRTTISFTLTNNSAFALLGGHAWVRYRMKASGQYA